MYQINYRGFLGFSPQFSDISYWKHTDVHTWCQCCMYVIVEQFNPTCIYTLWHAIETDPWISTAIEHCPQMKLSLLQIPTYIQLYTCILSISYTIYTDVYCHWRSNERPLYIYIYTYISIYTYIYIYEYKCTINMNILY